MLTNTKKAIFIPGASGQLETLVDLPKESNSPKGAVIICHPHPLKQGTMRNKVVYYLAKTFNHCAYASVRFNYRGVELSQGQYDNGIGETEDALSVFDWARTHLEKHQPIWLAGFSFGCYVAIRASQQREVAGLITIAPAVNFLDFKSLNPPQIPWLMIHGDKDEVVPIKDALSWYNRLPNKPELHIMAEAGHFFHGRLNDLRVEVSSFLQNHSNVDRLY